MRSKVFIAVILIVLLVAVGILVAFTKKSETTTNNLSVTPTPLPTSTEIMDTNMPTSSPVSATPVKSTNVSIENFAFTPSNITVNTGDSVTWTNNDSAQHKIVFDNGSGISSSAVLSKGDTFKVTFDKKGTFGYKCGIHPSMTGSVIVN